MFDKVFERCQRGGRVLMKVTEQLILLFCCGEIFVDAACAGKPIKNWVFFVAACVDSQNTEGAEEETSQQSMEGGERTLVNTGNRKRLRSPQGREARARRKQQYDQRRQLDKIHANSPRLATRDDEKP